MVSAAALAAGCIVASPIFAQDPAERPVQVPVQTADQEKAELPAQEKITMPIQGNAADGLEFDFGGDIRARYEFKDNWPDKGKSTAGSAYEDYLRLRTKVWAKPRREISSCF